jgi:molecular chaperone GrpE
VPGKHGIPRLRAFDAGAKSLKRSARDPMCSTVRADFSATTPMTAPDYHTDDPASDETLAPSHDAPASGDNPLERAQAEAAELKDAWLRARAEVENVRRQGQADVAKAHKYAIEKFADDLLAVKDALEQTLATDRTVSIETLKAGAELTLKALDAAFARAHIQVVDPAPGQKFDPHQQQAMQTVASDLPPNTVVTVFQKGYMINDRVLRPALVTVAKAPEGGSDTAAR